MTRASVASAVLIVAMLAGCQNNLNGPQPRCVIACILTEQPKPPVSPPVAAPAVDEEIIIPPSRRSTVIRRFAP